MGMNIFFILIVDLNIHIQNHNTHPPFTLYPTGSTEVLNWIGSLEQTHIMGTGLSASDYDQNNRDWLYWSIPEYLRDDPANKI